MCPSGLPDPTYRDAQGPPEGESRRRSEVSCVDRRSSWRCSLDLTPYPLLSTASPAELLGPRRPVHNSPHQPRELGHDVPSSSLGGRWQTGTPFWGGRPLPARVGHLKPTLMQLRCRPGAATDGGSRAIASYHEDCSSWQINPPPKENPTHVSGRAGHTRRSRGRGHAPLKPVWRQ
jgi:hypothetical protein